MVSRAGQEPAAPAEAPKMMPTSPLVIARAPRANTSVVIRSVEARRRSQRMVARPTTAVTPIARTTVAGERRVRLPSIS